MNSAEAARHATRHSLRTPRLPFLGALIGVALAAAGGTAAAPAQSTPSLDTGFHLLYELKFSDARAQFTAWQKAHPDDSLGYASEAASYLFEELYRQGVFTSEFFLDDKKLLEGVPGKPNETARKSFLASNQRAQELAKRRLAANPNDADALFALTLTTGMQADYSGLIEKRHLESLKLTRQAEAYAEKLLALKPDAQDAYLALGAANYIIGCLPAYKRFFLWFGGIHGDRERGMAQLEATAQHGHYLQPFAKTLLALASLREKRPERARALFQELTAEFPDNPSFARELSLLEKRAAGARTSP